MVREAISQTSIAKTSMRKTSSVRKTSSMRKTSIAVGISGVSSSKSVGESSLTPLPLSRSSGSNSSKMSSLGFSNLWSVNWGNKGLWVEGGGNKRLWVEGGSNAGIDWSNGQTRVSNAESSCISNILNLLKLTIGINIRVSTGDSAISVSDNMSVGVDVGVTIVQVSELILSMELASSRVWSISSIGRGGSSISNWGSGNWSWGSGISICWSSSSSVGKTSIASIGKVTVRITTISQRGGYDLSLIS